MIRKATIAENIKIKELVDITCDACYPTYYEQAVVNAMKNFHDDRSIKDDIAQGNVYVYEVDGKIVGTISTKKDQIKRLFVDVEHQKKGIGKELLGFAEIQIFTKYNQVFLDSSEPSKPMYLKNGYKLHEKRLFDCGDNICVLYDVMTKEKER